MLGEEIGFFSLVNAQMAQHSRPASTLSTLISLHSRVSVLDPNFTISHRPRDSFHDVLKRKDLTRRYSLLPPFFLGQGPEG